MTKECAVEKKPNTAGFAKKIYRFFFPIGSRRRNYVQNLRHKHYLRYEAPWAPYGDKEMNKLITHRKRAFLHGRYADEESRRIASLKNRHVGESCFIVCTGPSLQVSDLGKIKGYYSFGVNSILDSYPLTDWRPTYYCVVDPYDYADALAQKDPAGGRYATNESFFHYRLHPKHASEQDFFLPVDCTNHDPSALKKREIRLSDELSVCVCDAFTVAAMAIQIAVYMGFKKIFLLGADNSYTHNSRHFMESEMTDAQKLVEDFSEIEDRARMGFAACKEFCKEKNVEIFNATRGGRLEVFERADLDEIVEAEKFL